MLLMWCGTYPAWAAQVGIRLPPNPRSWQAWSESEKISDLQKKISGRCTKTGAKSLDFLHFTCKLWLEHIICSWKKTANKLFLSKSQRKYISIENISSKISIFKIFDTECKCFLCFFHGKSKQISPILYLAMDWNIYLKINQILD